MFLISSRIIVNIFLAFYLIGGYGVYGDEPLSNEKTLITISGISNDGNNISLSALYFTTIPNNYELSLPSKGPFTVELLSDKGIVLASYHFGTDKMGIHYVDGGYEEKDSGLFNIDIPFDKQTKKVVISKDSKVLREIVRSPSAPKVSFKKSIKGEELRGEIKLEWSGYDADGDVLQYRLEYSSDGGYLWEPLFGPGPLTEYVVNTEYLKPANKAIFRVAAIDGLNVNWAKIEVKVRNPIRVTQTYPFPGKTGVFYGIPEIRVNFVGNKIKESTVNAESLVLLENGKIPIPVKNIRMLCLENLVIFQFDGRLSLKPGTKYAARLIAGIEDVEGNVLEDDYEWSFTTEAKRFLNPQVDRVSPGRGNRNVPINALIQATFENGFNRDNIYYSDDIDSNTVNSGSVILKDGNGNIVDGVVSYNHETKSALFTPDAKLLPKSEYTAILTTSIADSHGLHLESDYAWSFTTGAQQSADVTITKIDYDQGIDINKDGLYDKLVLKAQMQVLKSCRPNINVRLVSNKGYVTSDIKSLNFSHPGVYLIDFEFKGSDIAGSAADGPYEVYFGWGSINNAGSGPNSPRSSDLSYQFLNGYRTYPYKAKDFSL